MRAGWASLPPASPPPHASAAAQSYPAQLLSRSVNEFNADICAYRNQEHDLRRIIILCDADERLAQPAARLCWEKGIDNCFILTGGLRAFATQYHELLTLGPGPLPENLLHIRPSTAPAAHRSPRPSSAVSIRSEGRRPSSIDGSVHSAMWR